MVMIHYTAALTLIIFILVHQSLSTVVSFSLGLVHHEQTSGAKATFLFKIGGGGGKSEQMGVYSVQVVSSSSSFFLLR